MKDDRVINFQEKDLKDFGPEDTLYIRKTFGGFHFHYLCQFVALKKGVVHANVIRMVDKQPSDRDEDIPKTLNARPASCYLWGLDKDNPRMDWPHCHWYRKGKWS